MHLSMPPPNPRKRPAPGSSPVVQMPQMQQPFSAPSQLSNAEFLRWSQGPENASHSDPSTYNMNNYTGNAIPQPQYDSSITTPSTQLARRPINRQLVPTAQRTTYDNSSDPWGQFGDESILDPQNTNGVMEENDNIELLEERAAVAKRDAQSKRKQIPPFVQKLSSFLDESKNTDLIRWSDRGDSFVVLDEDEFAKTLIPELFKHNNYASFVRQLNMYGFHKRVGLSDNSMKASERKNKSPSEYYNPYFKRGHPNLLWLINKPKGGTSKVKGKRVKNEEGQDGESDEEGRDGIEETYGPAYGNNTMQGSSRAISAVPESGPLQRREIAVVQGQLADIQKQQGAISNAIARLRKDHNQLYQQAIAFQTLHDRHESSINAILTFLATVYNRSLDGQGPQNIAQMFANGIPQDPQNQHQGNVVDMGDLSNQQQQHPGSLSPRRRQQRLLMAPPSSDGQASTVSSTGYAQNTPRSGAIEELFESPGDTTHVKMENDMSGQLPRQGMMNIINNTNARSLSHDGKAMEFPEMLSRYENANGNSPLTSEQRSTMLNLIASTSSAPGSNNALVSPTPPQAPSLEDLGYTQAEIEELVRMQASQEARLNNIRASIEPLSPSGSIPGLNVDGYFNGTDASDPNNSNLDLDQFLDTGAFYNGSSPIDGGGADFNYGSFGEDQGLGVGESHFDVGMDGVGDVGGRIVETTGSSDVDTPDGRRMEEIQQSAGGLRSPGKRRRKN